MTSDAYTYQGRRSAFIDDLPKAIVVDRVKQACAEHYSVNPETLSGKCRARRLAEPRMIAMHILRETSGMNDGAIASHFNRSRVMVMHAANVVDGLMRYKEFSARYHAIAAQIEYK